MEEEGGGGLRLGKKDKGGEVEYKTKAGTAWSHSYLNQKPWHPLSYPNQRRKWIAEQTHAQRERRAEEVAREFAQEQEFFRQTALISKKEKEKVEMMKAVSFMYVRPPGYNAESAKAAEIADERKKLEPNECPYDQNEGGSELTPLKPKPGGDRVSEGKKKARPKDVFGRPLPTEEEFEVLKNAPRLETGVFARVKPFGIEVRNVKCVRCGNYGHQSGDRECPLKDVIMPNEESRLKRDDPLTSILAHTDSSEPLKWELKQKPGISPPRGGFEPDDPNQQIVAEDIFDEYGGFLSGGEIPGLLTNFSTKPVKKSKKSKSKHKVVTGSTARELKACEHDGGPSDKEKIFKEGKKHKQKIKKKKRHFGYSESGSSESLDEEEMSKEQKKHKQKGKKKKRRLSHSESGSSEGLEYDGRRGENSHRSVSSSTSADSGSDGHPNTSKHRYHRHHPRRCPRWHRHHHPDSPSSR